MIFGKRRLVFQMYFLTLWAPKVPSSSIKINRRLTSPQMLYISSHSHHNNLDGWIAVHVKGRMYFWQHGEDNTYLPFNNSMFWILFCHNRRKRRHYLQNSAGWVRRVSWRWRCVFGGRVCINITWHKWGVRFKHCGHYICMSTILNSTILVLLTKWDLICSEIKINSENKTFKPLHRQSCCHVVSRRTRYPSTVTGWCTKLSTTPQVLCVCACTQSFPLSYFGWI